MLASVTLTAILLSAGLLPAGAGAHPGSDGEADFESIDQTARQVSARSDNTAATRPLPDPLEAGWRGEAVCELLHEDGRQRVLRCTFAPGVGHERHFHAAHFGYTVAGGRMRITSEKGVREVEIPTGSSFTSDGVKWHEVLNVGDTTSIFLIVEPRDPG